MQILFSILLFRILLPRVIHSIRSFFFPSFNFLKLSRLSLNFPGRNNFLIFFFSEFHSPHHLLNFLRPSSKRSVLTGRGRDFIKKDHRGEEKKGTTLEEKEPPLRLLHPYFRNAFVSGQATFKVPDPKIQSAA